MATSGFILEITWEVPSLPRIVGMFDTRNEAEGWASLNIPNGTYGVRPVIAPYLSTLPGNTDTTSKEP